MALTDEMIARLTDGEKLVATYKGEYRVCVVRIIDGERRFRLNDDAKQSFGSPSKAASVATGTSVNGKLFWSTETAAAEKAKQSAKKADRVSSPVKTASRVVVALGGPLYEYLDAEGDSENGLLASILGACGEGDEECAALVAEAGNLLRSFKLQLGMIRLHREMVETKSAMAAAAERERVESARSAEAERMAEALMEAPVVSSEPTAEQLEALKAAMEQPEAPKGRRGKAA